MTFSRVDWLQQKLTETGHEAQQRIDWEIELTGVLEKRLKPRKKHEIVRKPSIIRRWNQKVLKGWKHEQYGEHRMPMNYTFHFGFIIPPYLLPAWSRFRKGETVFGLTTRCFYGTVTSEKDGVSWSSKTGKKQLRSSAKARADYEQDLAAFFERAPLVTYGECVVRFPESGVTGLQTEAEKIRLDEFDLKRRQELKKKKKAENLAFAEQQRIAKARRKAENAKKHSERDGWQIAEEALAERKARIADQNARVAAGKAAFIAKFGCEVFAYQKPQEEPAKPKKLSLKQRMAAAHKKLNAQ